MYCVPVDTLRLVKQQASGHHYTAVCILSHGQHGCLNSNLPCNCCNECKAIFTFILLAHAVYRKHRRRTQHQKSEQYRSINYVARCKNGTSDRQYNMWTTQKQAQSRRNKWHHIVSTLGQNNRKFSAPKIISDPHIQ